MFFYKSIIVDDCKGIVNINSCLTAVSVFQSTSGTPRVRADSSSCRQGDTAVRAKPEVITSLPAPKHRHDQVIGPLINFINQETNTSTEATTID